MRQLLEMREDRINTKEIMVIMVHSVFLTLGFQLKTPEPKGEKRKRDNEREKKNGGIAKLLNCWIRELGTPMECFRSTYEIKANGRFEVIDVLFTPLSKYMVVSAMRRPHKTDPISSKPPSKSLSIALTPGTFIKQNGDTVNVHRISSLLSMVNSRMCSKVVHEDKDKILWLPDNVLIGRLLEFLDWKDLCSVGMTCRALKLASSSPSLWKSITFRIFPNTNLQQILNDNVTTVNWKAIFSGLMLRKKAAEELRNAEPNTPEFWIPAADVWPEPMPVPMPYPIVPNPDFPDFHSPWPWSGFFPDNQTGPTW